jgi:hypothetical protein
MPTILPYVVTVISNADWNRSRTAILGLMFCLSRLFFLAVEVSSLKETSDAK